MNDDLETTTKFKDYHTDIKAHAQPEKYLVGTASMNIKRGKLLGLIYKQKH